MFGIPRGPADGRIDRLLKLVELESERTRSIKTYSKGRTQRVGFFFQAEDGIRDLTVTGVQTCALPIYLHQARAVQLAAAPQCRCQLHPQRRRRVRVAQLPPQPLHQRLVGLLVQGPGVVRSEERRVGKECRSRWSPYH